MKKESLILKINRSVLPILSGVHITKGFATISNLTTTFVSFIDYHGDDKITMVESLDGWGAKECFSGYGGHQPEEYPNVRNNFVPAGSIELDEQNTLDLLTALNFVSNNHLRPILTGVFIGKDIVSTDAHKLFRKRITSYSKRKKKFTEIVLMADAIKLLKAQNVKSCTIEFDKEKVLNRITGDGFYIITRNIKGKSFSLSSGYPDYDAIIPVLKDQSEVKVDRKVFLNALNKLNPLANRATKEIQIHRNNSKKNMLRLTVNDGDRGIPNTSITVDCTGKFKKPFAFNVQTMILCVKNIKAEVLTIHYSEPTNAILLDKDILLMPKIIYNYNK